MCICANVYILVVIQHRKCEHCSETAITFFSRSFCDFTNFYNFKGMLRMIPAMISFTYIFEASFMNMALAFQLNSKLNLMKAAMSV